MSNPSTWTPNALAHRSEGEHFPLQKSRTNFLGSNLASLPAENNEVGEIGLNISEYLKISS